MISGSIDKLTPQGAIGWLYRADLVEPTLIRAFFNHELVGETVAGNYRPDLEQVGFGNGHCGFDMTFTRPLTEAQLPFVSIRPDNVDLSLSLTDKSIYLDLLHAIVDSGQGAGRNRSVLGGFWTDRTDASQMLAGRVATGSCAGELRQMLQELIANGCVLLPGLLGPRGITQGDLRAIHGEGRLPLKEALEAMGRLVFCEAAIRLLRAVLDDHPVIYRFDEIEEETAFHQAASVEVLPSPAESLLLYVGLSSGNSRIEFLRDSHEMGEFGAGGQSRWTADGSVELTRLASQEGLSIGEVEFNAIDVLVVGPGLVHRVVSSPDSPVLRMLITPRRVTPLRFLSGRDSWVEGGHVSGARIRLAVLSRQWNQA